MGGGGRGVGFGGGVWLGGVRVDVNEELKFLGEFKKKFRGGGGVGSGGGQVGVGVGLVGGGGVRVDVNAMLGVGVMMGMGDVNQE